MSRPHFTPQYLSEKDQFLCVAYKRMNMCKMQLFFRYQNQLEIVAQ